MTTFADLGARPETVEALERAGIVEPFAIQELAIPLALQGNDIIGQARTGTGKTLAFGVPLLQVVEPVEGDPRPQALVVAPTRELAIQVAGDIEKAGATRGVRVTTIYGGRSYEPQIEALRTGVEVVVGTPGRLLDLARQRHLDLSQVRHLVLDEADEMLDLGFLPDVERILALLPQKRQTMLFSATMPSAVVTLARRYLTQPTHVRAEMPDETATVPTTQQHVFRAHALDKMEMLARILQAQDRGLTMIFCRTKRTCDKVAADLTERGFAAGAVHGDLGQGARERALRAFRNGKVDVLVATDVAARGIDVTGVTHVINYQCPEDEKVYLHRIGRTGRAGGSGVAVTLVDWDEVVRWKVINSALDLPFADPAETYSSSEHLYEALDIPAEAGSTLPKEKRTRAGLYAEEEEDLGEPGRARRPREPRESRDRDRDRGGEPAKRRPRRRSRSRTRGGEPVSDAGGAVAGPGSAPATDESAATGGSTGGSEHANPARRRRRRRRSGHPAQPATDDQQAQSA